MLLLFTLTFVFLLPILYNAQLDSCCNQILQAQDKHHCSRIASYQNRVINLLTVKTVVLCPMVSCETEMVLQSMISAIDEDRTIEILSYRFVETMIKQSGLGDKTEDSYL
jgi:hypothetical protein